MFASANSRTVRQMLHLALFWMVVAVLAFPLRSVGFTVTDPVSYTYFVEQIKQMSSQLQEAQKAVDTLGGIKTNVDKVNSQLRGTYNRAMGAVQQIKDIRESIEKTPSTVQGQLEKWGKVKGKVEGFVDANLVLDQTFSDPRTQRDNRHQGTAARYDMRQAALKKSIASADMLLQRMPERLRFVEELASKIDTTANVKDATDLQNRIAIEQLKVLMELLTMTAHLAESQSLVHYEGTTDEGTKESKAALAEGVESFGPLSSEIEGQLKKLGVTDYRKLKVSDFSKLGGMR